MPGIDFCGDLHEASTPVFMTDKLAIIEFYKEKFGVGKSGNTEKWKGEIVNDIMNLETDKPRKRASVNRGFEAGRDAKPARQKTQKEMYTQLGETLPPDKYKVPENGYRISMTVDLRISAKCGNVRSFDATISGDEATKMLAECEPMIVVDAYFEGEENNCSEGICKIIELSIEGLN